MTWVTKQEYRQSHSGLGGLTINAAFLQEIKEDHVDYRWLLDQTMVVLSHRPVPQVRDTAEWLWRFRDALESYFALEEFYGYLKGAPVANPAVAAQAVSLQQQHGELYCELNGIIESAEQMLYHESSAPQSLESIAERFQAFYHHLHEHEQAEGRLLLVLNNQDFGEGD